MRLLSALTCYLLAFSSSLFWLGAAETYAACSCLAESHCGCLDGGECHCSAPQKTATTPPKASSTDTYDPSATTDDQYAGGITYDYSTSLPTDEDDSQTDLQASKADCCEEKHYEFPFFITDDGRYQWPCYTTGTWMPERPPLFRPFIADPREPTYSIGWRFNDNALTKNVIDVSYWDSFPFYGWCNFWFCGDKLQIDLEGCLWAVFDPCTFSAPLMNADYYVGVPITYAYGPWSSRLRVFHISSHVGDEFLLNHPGFDRRNPSAEYIDWFVAYQYSDDIRLYGGLGWVIQQDESYKCGRFYAEGGVEARICSLGFYDRCNQLYGVPFLAIHLRHKQDFKRHVDATYALGYEFGKKTGLERRLRFYLEYHDGYSVEGQWSCKPTNYLSVRAQYGF